MTAVYSRTIWIDVGASNNLWGAEQGLTREKLASVTLLGAPFAGGTMPAVVYSVELKREVGRVERIEMRGPELWAELTVEEAALEVPGTHAEGLYAMEPERTRLFAVLLTNEPRGMMSRLLGEFLDPERRAPVCCRCGEQGEVVNRHAHDRSRHRIEWKCQECRRFVCINCVETMPGPPVEIYEGTWCSPECRKGRQ